MKDEAYAHGIAFQDLRVVGSIFNSCYFLFVLDLYRKINSYCLVCDGGETAQANALLATVGAHALRGGDEKK